MYGLLSVIAFCCLIVLPISFGFSFKIIKKIFVRLKQIDTEKSDRLYSETTPYFNLIEKLFKNSTRGRTTRSPNPLLIHLRRSEFFKIGDNTITSLVKISSLLLFIEISALVFLFLYFFIL